MAQTASQAAVYAKALKQSFMEFDSLLTVHHYASQ
jgi:hypothetical protein